MGLNRTATRERLRDALDEIDMIELNGGVYDEAASDRAHAIEAVLRTLDMDWTEEEVLNVARVGGVTGMMIFYLA